jgi:hypothetical protein
VNGVDDLGAVDTLQVDARDAEVCVSGRTRFYRRDVGPSRWLMVVVSYEQEPARIITALANRKYPKGWKP